MDDCPDGRLSSSQKNPKKVLCLSVVLYLSVVLCLYVVFRIFNDVFMQQQNITRQPHQKKAKKLTEHSCKNVQNLNDEIQIKITIKNQN